VHSQKESGFLKGLPYAKDPKSLDFLNIYRIYKHASGIFARATLSFAFDAFLSPR